MNHAGAPSPTRALREADRIDVAAVEAWMDQHVEGFAGPLEILGFEGGQSNPTFLLVTASASYVLRKKPTGDLLPSAHAIDREYRVISALADSEVPVAHLRGYCDDASLVGTEFYLMDYQPGRIFTNPLLDGSTPQERSAIYDSMNVTLARLHRVDWRGVGLGEFGRPEKFVERQLSRWSKQYSLSRSEDVASMELLRDWLVAHVPDDEQATITHGDYRLGNLIYDQDTPTLAAVLDWELATIGHPFSDLAFNCMTYHLPAGHPVAAGFVGADLAALGIPEEDEYLEAYAERSGRDPRPHWRFYMAFSLFRTAAIQQGVYARALRGNANSTIAHQFGEGYRIVADAGLRLTS
ncbi:MAG: phosphotransferase family protein [Acidimicrobiaceae bacterium]|nr:phosphotransferase family protein [Acidimicrobiaceae bacterium]